MTAELARPNDLAGTIAAWLGGKSNRTQTEYIKCLSAFANFALVTTSGEAVARLFAGTRGDAARAADAWKAQMMQAGLSAATINQRLSALRSVVEIARRHEIIEWSLDVEGVKAEARRDARGCSWADYERVLAAEPSVRNRALLLLMGDRALRRAEVAALEIDDVGAGEIRVLGKGRREKETLALNDRTMSAIEWWVEERGTEAGSLFGIAAQQIHEIVVAAGKRVGIKLRPHGLRHASITHALNAMNGDVRKVQRFARHSSSATTLRYDDERQNHATEVVTRMEAYRATPKCVGV